MHDGPNPSVFLNLLSDAPLYPYSKYCHVLFMIHIATRQATLSRKGPPKGNGRPGFHESAIPLLRQGMVAGTTLAALPCPVLSALPRIISDETSENNRQGNRECVKFILKRMLCQGPDEKNSLKFPRRPLTFKKNEPEIPIS